MYVARQVHVQEVLLRVRESTVVLCVMTLTCFHGCFMLVITKHQIRQKASLRVLPAATGERVFHSECGVFTGPLMWNNLLQRMNSLPN